MTETYAYIACFVFACLVIFQLALILGAPIGKFAWGGYHEVLPKKLRIASLISVFSYLAFSVTILESAGLVSLFSSDRMVSIVMWLVTTYFFIGVIMNGISRSKYERTVMTPVVLALAVLFLLVAWS